VISRCEQALLTRKLCEQLGKSFKTHLDQRFNRTLYLLTVVTSVIAPITMFSGIYGMNADTIPEVKYEWFYLIFWLLAIAWITFALRFFYKHRYL